MLDILKITVMPNDFWGGYIVYFMMAMAPVGWIVSQGLWLSRLPLLLRIVVWLIGLPVAFLTIFAVSGTISAVLNFGSRFLTVASEDIGGALSYVTQIGAELGVGLIFGSLSWALFSIVKFTRLRSRRALSYGDAE